MKRTKHPTPDKVDLILTGDFHLREDQPICRTDNLWTHQWIKVDIIQELQVEHDCPVIHAGDLFNHWKPSPWLLSETILHLPVKFNTIYGNHDLPQHNYNLAYKSGIDTLEMAEALDVMIGGHWGTGDHSQFAGSAIPTIHDWKVLVCHIMTYIGESPWPGCEDPTAEELLDRYPDYDLIVTGHNHKSFTFQKDERLLVNPGAITRQSANEAAYLPCVYLWTAETNTVIPYFLPINKDVISREHIERKEERDARIEAFVERLNTEFEGVIDFRENLERFEKENEVRTSVMDIIWKAIENA